MLALSALLDLLWFFTGHKWQAREKICLRRVNSIREGSHFGKKVIENIVKHSKHNKIWVYTKTNSLNFKSIFFTLDWTSSFILYSAILQGTYSIFMDKSTVTAFARSYSRGTLTPMAQVLSLSLSQKHTRLHAHSVLDLAKNYCIQCTV